MMTVLKKAVVSGLIFCLGCARAPETLDGKRDFASLRKSALAHQEAEAGLRMHQAIISSHYLYTEPRTVGYVTRIGRSIAKVTDRPDLAYRFTVLYDERAYATFAPGGYVYVTTGFLNYLQNEAEFAAILAHEIAELQYRDPNFSGPKKAFKAVSYAGMAVAPLFGQIGLLAAGALILVGNVTGVLPRADGDKVKIADKKALRYLVNARYDPQGYLHVMERMLNVPPEWSPYFYDYFTSRPLDLDRYTDIQKQFRKLPLEGKSFDVHRARFLQMTKSVREIYNR